MLKYSKITVCEDHVCICDATSMVCWFAEWLTISTKSTIRGKSVAAVPTAAVSMEPRCRVDSISPVAARSPVAAHRLTAAHSPVAAGSP